MRQIMASAFPYRYGTPRRNNCGIRFLAGCEEGVPQLNIWHFAFPSGRKMAFPVSEFLDFCSAASRLRGLRSCPPASLINQTIGNYRVTSQLGEGGMGVVYLAEHPVIGRKVAIKLLHAVLARDPDIVARFFNEARAIHMIAHENIVEILDFGQTADGQPYFIMEYLTGRVAERARSAAARWPSTSVEAIGVQMCRALGGGARQGDRPPRPQAGQHAAVHQGRRRAAGEDPRLRRREDPCVARRRRSSVKTRTGSLMGTPLYMSPEQCKGAGRARPPHRHLLAGRDAVRDAGGPAAVHGRGRGRAVREAHARGSAAGDGVRARDALRTWRLRS